MALHGFAQMLVIVAIAASANLSAAWQAAAPAPAGADAAAKEQKMAAVNKVITMLEDLKGEVLQEGEKEAASYNTFSCFCKDTQSQRTTAITEGTDEKERLQSVINQLASDRDGLDTTIANLQTDIANIEDEMKKAKKEREETLLEYTKNEADLSGAIEALENAIKVLNAAKPALVQTKAVISEGVRNAVILADVLGLQHAHAGAALIQQDPPSEAYSFHSDDVISTLEGLLTDFRQEKSDVDEAETKSVQAHESFMQEKTTELETKNGELDEAKKDKAQKQEEIATNSQDLSTIAAQLLADQEYAKELATMCSDKAKIWDQRSQVRQDELQALVAAIGIIQSTVSEKTTAATIRFAQQGVSVAIAKQLAKSPMDMNDLEAETEEFEATGFLQRRQVTQHQPAGSKQTNKDGREMVVSLLKSKGQELKSKVLSALASEIEAAKGDPFAKVKTLIQELIERMLQQSSNEATQKGWCDKSLSDARQKRDHAAEEIAELNGSLAQLEARIDKLAQEIEKLGEQITDLEAKQAEAVQLRADEKAENEATVSAAKEGLSAVQEAIRILREFYGTANNSEAPAALVQKQTPGNDAPDAGFKGVYKGKQAEAGGVIGMLEVIESDFQRTVTETEKAEAEAEEAHLEFMTETGKSLAEKNQAKTDYSTQKDDAEGQLTSEHESLDAQMELLESAISELLELKPACIDTSMSYEERVARRQEEVAALKQALCILDNYAQYGPDAAAAECPQ